MGSDSTNAVEVLHANWKAKRRKLYQANRGVKHVFDLHFTNNHFLQDEATLEIYNLSEKLEEVERINNNDVYVPQKAY